MAARPQGLRGPRALSRKEGLGPALEDSGSAQLRDKSQAPRTEGRARGEECGDPRPQNWGDAARCPPCHAMP